jgi:ATP-dependent Lhr-like helicase
MSASPLSRFSLPSRRWFEESFEAPTPVQREGWQRIAAKQHTLMLAPTGSGKTLAAFYWCIDQLARRVIDPARAPSRGTRVLYISPIKALAYDIERNLRAPLIGIQRVAAREDIALHPIDVDVRTGDTSSRERRQQAKHPADILITTPESLFLLLGSAARANLATVQTVIVDEIHALAGNKRGVHLALSLERLSRLTPSDPQRIGLSATQRPLAEVARYLGGDRRVEVVDASEKPALDLQIVVPVADMQAPLAGESRSSGPLLREASASTPEERRSIWPAIYPRLLELVQQHRSTIVFVNSRRLAERLAQQLNELAQQELVLAHHGSLARHQRKQVEEQLKTGQLRGIVATSSLELGIDMGAVDLVIQVESPKAVSRGLQRLGRAGHGVGQLSRGRLFPKFRGDLLETTVVAQRMLRGEVEALRVPKNTLDVLAQQVVAMCTEGPWKLDTLERTIRRSYSFRELSRDALVELLDMLSGRYPSDEMADLRPRISWDRQTDTLTARRGAKLLCAANAGTIPDRGSYAVHLGLDGPRVGELDEEMVYESRPGDIFLLGASSWRIEQITRDRVLVSPAPGEPGRMPFWRGEGPGRPLELGRALGAFVRQLGAMEADEALTWLQTRCHLDELAARNLQTYIAEERSASGALPTDQTVVVQRFVDELGDWRICILSPFGARVHAPWAIALQAQLSERAGFEVQTLWSDDGIVLRFAGADDPPESSALVPEPEEVEDLLLRQLPRSALFASHFRQSAARALLLPRRHPNARAPLWAQRLRAQQLLAVALRYPSFPIVLETYRECLQDVFDLPALVGLLEQFRSRSIQLVEVETTQASPFARALVFAYVAAYLYEGDAPLAERRAQALTLDRTLLRDLLGGEALRDLLDLGVIAEVEAELQHLPPDYRARDADELNDLLRRLGDLSLEELSERCSADPTPWVESLEQQRRICRIRLGGQERLIAIEEINRYRDALGVQVPAGLPEALLEPAERALERLLLRWARRHAPFVATQPANRFGLPRAQVEAVLAALLADETLLRGAFRPDGAEPEWCHPAVLRQLRRRTLAQYRAQIEPTDPSALGRFLPTWQSVGSGRAGLPALRDAIAQVEGLALPFSELQQRILPARVADFQPRMLDELGALGEIVWVGAGPLGQRDGLVALYRRERAELLLEPPGADLPTQANGPLHQRLVTLLQQRGACFLVAMRNALSDVSAEDLQSALWELVWNGIVTNDTFEPLRSLRSQRTTRPRKRSNPGGRWSLVSELVDTGAQPTARLHARACMLLDRYGIATREAASAEGTDGGFASLARVLRVMEEAGKVRRGYFVDGLHGMQFAHAGAVDRLRQLRDPDRGPTLALAACDPANPYGSLLPWPQTGDPNGRPARRAGASIVLAQGRPILYLSRTRRRLWVFQGSEQADLELALRDGLSSLLDSCRIRSLQIDEIDGRPATEGPLTGPLIAAGFREVYRSLVLERPA